MNRNIMAATDIGMVNRNLAESKDPVTKYGIKKRMI
tara:strand:+ start:17992 stop:18099 length:108 start_codon:yes stop_codon:yes gene_type:complete